MSAVLWWAYLLAYGAMPFSLSTDLYRLFVGVVAAAAQYWLYLLLIPVACLLPDFFWRSVRRYVLTMLNTSTCSALFALHHGNNTFD